MKYITIIPENPAQENVFKALDKLTGACIEAIAEDKNPNHSVMSLTKVHANLILKMYQIGMKEQGAKTDLNYIKRLGTEIKAQILSNVLHKIGEL